MYHMLPFQSARLARQNKGVLWQTSSFLNKGWVFNARDEIAALFQAQLCVSTSVTVRNSGFATQFIYVFRVIRTDLNDGPL